METGSVQAGGSLQQGGGGVSPVTVAGPGHHHRDTFIVTILHIVTSRVTT